MPELTDGVWVIRLYAKNQYTSLNSNFYYDSFKFGNELPDMIVFLLNFAFYVEKNPALSENQNYYCWSKVENNPKNIQDIK